MINRLSVNGINDYSEIYAEDAYMEEMGDDARVFRVYNNESEVIDNEQVEGWLSILNTLLIFVSKFQLSNVTYNLNASTGRSLLCSRDCVRD